MQASRELVCDAGLETMRRLKAICQSQKINTQVVAQKFVLERVVHRLFSSEYAEMFALKGGILMMQVEDVSPLLARNTEDIDLQVPGFDGTIAEFEDVVRDVLSRMPEQEDGIRFDLRPGAIRRTARNEESVPGGSLHIPAQIGPCGIKFKIDVTFDSRPVFTVAVDDRLPSIMPDRFGSVPVRRIPLSWTLADKIQAQVRHGDRTTRLKDFYDIALIVSRGLADEAETVDALRMTFDLFRCPMPRDVDEIAALSPAYAVRNADAWEREKASRRFAVPTPGLPDVVEMVRESVRPLIERANLLEATGPEAYLERIATNPVLRERMEAAREARGAAPAP